MSLANFKAAIQAGQHQVARWLFAQLLDDPALTREELAQAYFDASVAEYRAGHLRTAIAWCRVAATLASEVEQLLLLSRISLNLMEFERLAGNPGTAIEIGQRWLSEHGDKPEVACRKGRYLYNLAVAHRQRDEVDRALEHYELAWTRLGEAKKNHPDPAERSRSQMYEAMALCNAAWLMYEVGLVQLADNVVEKARRVAPEDNQSLGRELSLLSAYKAHWAGDAASVLELVGQVFSVPTPAPTHQLFWSYWLAAHAYKRLGKAGIASAYATMAAQEAEETKDATLVRRGRRIEEELA